MYIFTVYRTSSNFPEPTGDVSPPVSPAVEQVASVIEQEEKLVIQTLISYAPLLLCCPSQ